MRGVLRHLAREMLIAAVVGMTVVASIAIMFTILYASVIIGGVVVIRDLVNLLI
jgi:hypothetical protein